MFSKHALIYKMADEHDVTKDDLQKVLDDHDELLEEYGYAIEMLGQFDTEALKEVAEEQ